MATVGVKGLTNVQEKMLRNLSNNDKRDLTDLLEAIEKTFSLYWQHYQPYQTLQDRGTALDSLLRDTSEDNRKGM